jgi:hypothetical protein
MAATVASVRWCEVRSGCRMTTWILFILAGGTFGSPGAQTVSPFPDQHALGRFIAGTSENPGFSFAELRQISDAFRSAYQEASAEISHRLMSGTRPEDPEMDFG